MNTIEKPTPSESESAATIDPRAGKPAEEAMLIDTAKLIAAFYTQTPDYSIPSQRVSFGTSGHRGSAFDNNFNLWHILAVSQAVCDYRRRNNIDGPLFLGVDTHALSEPARIAAVEVLAANKVQLMLAIDDEYTPTPALSHAILTYNRQRSSGPADGIVITPSHNPPRYGGFKYNPPSGGPAAVNVTQWIEQRANNYLHNRLDGVQRMPLEKALRAANTHRYDFLNRYIRELETIVDMASIREANLSLAVDPLGGAGVHYWLAIAENYHLDLTVLNSGVDPTFRFMTVDWDGQIRMDPSSPYAMQSVLKYKDRFAVTVACDTDHDRHGIVTPSAGLMPPNHFLSVAVYYLLQHRPQWQPTAAIAKTAVSSQLINRIAAQLGRTVYETPVGFKWFVDGLLDGSLCFGGEESAGAVFSRRDGSVWTTDKDGIVMALLAAEITAKMGKDPGLLYRELTGEFGDPVYDRIEVAADAEQKQHLAHASAEQITITDLAGEKIQQILTTAPANGAALGGIKVVADSGWFALRPSGTEAIYKLYAESFRGAEHLQQIIAEAQALATNILNEVTI